MSSNRDGSLSLIRVLSMFMIVLCHLNSILNNSYYEILANFFDVGVPIFLILSGWLYSNKTIAEPKAWLVKRYLKLCIPFYIWGFITIILIGILFSFKFNIIDFFILLLNLQGIDRLIGYAGMPDFSINWMSHLWFITIIMICYITLLIIKKLEKEQYYSGKNLILFLFVDLILIVAFTYVKIYFYYIICFFIGYFLKRTYESLSIKQYLVIPPLVIFALAARIAGHAYFDDTILYVEIIAKITHLLLAVGIFYTLRMIYDKFGLIDKIVKGKMFIHFDKLSYYVYITHYFYLVSPFKMNLIFENKILQLIAFAVFTLASSEVLMFISEIANNGISKIIKVN